jgi:hypothetical protein
MLGRQPVFDRGNSASGKHRKLAAACIIGLHIANHPTAAMEAYDKRQGQHAGRPVKPHRDGRRTGDKDILHTEAGRRLRRLGALPASHGGRHFQRPQPQVNGRKHWRNLIHPFRQLYIYWHSQFPPLTFRSRSGRFQKLTDDSFISLKQHTALARLEKEKPSSSSSACICRDKAGCATCIRAAARLKFCASPAAQK